MERKDLFLISAQAIIFLGLAGSYWLFAQSYLYLPFLAMANFFAAALIVNLAVPSVQGGDRFYLSMLSASVLVVGFFFSIGLVREVVSYSIFLLPAVLSFASGVDEI